MHRLQNSLHFPVESIHRGRKDTFQKIFYCFSHFIPFPAQTAPVSMCTASRFCEGSRPRGPEEQTGRGVSRFPSPPLCAGVLGIGRNSDNTGEDGRKNESPAPIPPGCICRFDRRIFDFLQNPDYSRFLPKQRLKSFSHIFGTSRSLPGGASFPGKPPKSRGETCRW